MPVHRATQVNRAGGVVQIVHCRVGAVVGAKDLFRLARLVGRPAVGDGEGGEDHPLLVAQGDVLSQLDTLGEFLGHIQRDRHRPQRAVGEAHVLDHAVVVGLAHEPLERIEPAVHQQFQVTDLPRRQVPTDQVTRLHLQLLSGLVAYV